MIFALLAAVVADLNGTWILPLHGQALLKLTLTSDRSGRVTGSLTKPSKLQISSDGEVQAIGGQPVTHPLLKVKRIADGFTTRIDGDRFILKQQSGDRISLTMLFFRPWILGRAAADVQLATSLPEPLGTHDLRTQLKMMVKDDQEARVPLDFARMLAVDHKHLPELQRIFDRHGWVTKSLAGGEASHDFWLLVQHQDLEFQLRLLPALEKAAKAGEASMSDYAYLYDRVQTNQGKPQHWGTQVKCVKGKPTLDSVDDPAGLDERRKALFLPTVRDYLRAEYLVKHCAASR